jgi:hypothetical protein
MLGETSEKQVDGRVKRCPDGFLMVIVKNISLPSSSIVHYVKVKVSTELIGTEMFLKSFVNLGGELGTVILKDADMVA